MGRRERFLDPGSGPVQRFASELRELRETAGRPGYRELARRAHYSVTTLSQAAGGDALPSLDVTLAYVRACGGDEQAWRDRWHAVSDELSPKEESTDLTDPPYLGLATFQPDDADRFFGRDGLVDDLSRRVRESPFVAVIGPSGSGKSSLLRAGLLPAIGHGTVLLTPGHQPLEQLTKHTDETTPVIVVDQFEEVFTLCPHEHERSLFIDHLVTAAQSGRTRVVLGVRADFLGHCARYASLVDALNDGQLLVGPMRPDDLRSVIRQPAAQAGLSVETALVERVLADAGEEPGTLPLISHALLETWKLRSGRTLTLAGYLRAGGVLGAIARTADRVYAGFDADEQHIVRDIFLRLTAVGEGAEPTRRRAARDELLDRADGQAVVAVLGRLAAARLVTLDADTVEVAHEALIRSWPMLRSWLAEDHETVLAHRRLTEAVADWERHGRDESLLYRGARLAAWQDRPLDWLNDAERGFLTAGRRAEAREHRMRRLRTRLVIGGLSAVTVLVTVLAVAATALAARADDERTDAVARQLVADARAQLQLDPELGLLLARQAFATAPNEDTEAAVRQATADSHLRATLSGDEGKVTGVAFSPDGTRLATSGADGAIRVWAGGGLSRAAPLVLRGHDGEVWTPVFSPDGSRIAAAGVDGVVSVRSSDGRDEPVMLRGHDGAVWSVAFSPDGQRVASGGQDGTIRLWRVTGDDQPVVLRGHDGRVLSVAFSPDGARLASSGGDGTVRIWDLAGGTSPTVLHGHTKSVEATAFSPRGDRVATASTDGTVRVWDTTGLTDPVVLGSHDGTAEGVAYSADGHWVASTGNDGTVRLWNADHHAGPAVLRGHHGTVWAAAFSPDGKTVASASDDGTAKVWAVDDVEDVSVLRGHVGPIWDAVTSPDGRRVASGGQDGTVRLWRTSGDPEPTVLSGTGRPVRQVTFSPDGRRLAAVDGDGTVIVWDTGDLAEPARLRPPGKQARRVAFSPNGDRLVVGSNDSSLLLWDTSGTGEPERLPGNGSTLFQVAWSPDGRHVAAGALDGAVLVWDLRTGAAPTVSRGHQGEIWTLAFNRDGTRLASGGNDGTVRVWHVGGTTGPTVLRGHQGVVWHVTFGPDGRHLATSGNDATVRIWRTDGAGEPLVLDGFRAGVETVTQIAGDRYVTTHDDGTVRLWRCRACGPIDDVLSHDTTRQLTTEERRTYLP